MPKPTHLITIFVAAALVFVAAGCGGGGTYSPTVGQSAPVVVTPITIAITAPIPAATVTGGATVQFVDQVTGTDNTNVTWQVVSEGGGSISSTGLYTSGSQTGVFTIKVISQADPTKFATTTVTVTAAQGSVGGNIH